MIKNITLGVSLDCGVAIVDSEPNQPENLMNEKPEKFTNHAFDNDNSNDDSSYNGDTIKGKYPTKKKEQPIEGNLTGFAGMNFQFDDTYLAAHGKFGFGITQNSTPHVITGLHVSGGWSPWVKGPHVGVYLASDVTQALEPNSVPTLSLGTGIESLIPRITSETALRVTMGIKYPMDSTPLLFTSGLGVVW